MRAVIARGARRALLPMAAAAALVAACARGTPPGGERPAPATAARGDTAARPNVIVVLIDDMGYGDLSVYGERRVSTPNIDRLARDGTRFTQYYANSPICSPSRVALTTGTYPSRWRVHSFLEARGRNAARSMADWLDPAAPTLARTLKEAGYATAHFGKWHMGGGRDVGDAPLPQAYGFDESVTSFEGLGERFLWPDRLNEASAKLGQGPIHWTEKSETSRLYADRAIDFIRRHRDGPFYLNLWPNDVHDEFLPRAGAEAAFRDRAANDEEAKFFAVLTEMDRQLGRVFDELRRLGIERNTIVVFTSDNGPTDWPRYYRAGIEPPGSAGPFRGRKWSLYEGGVRMPLIVHWPGHTPAGTVDSSSVFSSIDLVPSLAQMTGTRVPAAPLDGEDVSPALVGRPTSRRAPLFWYYPNDIRPGNAAYLSPPLAVRDGRWKLLVQMDGTGRQLYDLATDPAERTDRAADEPEITARLSDAVLAWRRGLPQ